MTEVAVFNTPAEMHKIILITNGLKKANLPVYKSIIAGIVSGFFVMIGAHGMISLLSGSETNTKPVYLLSGVVFAVAIMSILILGGELFTSNCLLLVTALSGKISWLQVAKNWLIVYFANFAGNIFFAVMLFGTGFYGFSYEEHTPHAAALCKTVHGKVSPPAYQQFFRAVFANFCVCMACMLATAARSVEGKVLGMVWPIMVFVLSGFEHSIANQGFFALATLVNCPTSHGWYWVNLSVTTPGNIVGAALIGLSFYAVSLWRSDQQAGEGGDKELLAVVTTGSVSSHPNAVPYGPITRLNDSASHAHGPRGHDGHAESSSHDCHCNAMLAQQQRSAGVVALAMHKVESQSVLDQYAGQHLHPNPSGLTTPVGRSVSKMTSVFVRVPSTSDAYCAVNGCTSPSRGGRGQRSEAVCVESEAAKADIGNAMITVDAPY